MRLTLVVSGYDAVYTNANNITASGWDQLNGTYTAEYSCTEASGGPECCPIDWTGSSATSIGQTAFDVTLYNPNIGAGVTVTEKYYDDCYNVSFNQNSGGVFTGIGTIPANCEDYFLGATPISKPAWHPIYFTVPSPYLEIDYPCTGTGRGGTTRTAATTWEVSYTETVTDTTDDSALDTVTWAMTIEWIL